MSDTGNFNPLNALKSQMASLAFSNPLYNLSLTGDAPEELLYVPTDPWPSDLSRGRLLLKGTLCFADQTVETGEGGRTNWEPFGVDDAWLVGMHGFEWLRDLRAIGGDTARQKARTLIADWINQYRSWDSISWRPDIMGLRITSWISAYDFTCASADDAFCQRFLESLARQGRHLARVLPGKHYGLPLIQAIKGLIYSGVCLPGGEERTRQGLKLLNTALEEQLLPDGGHITRNPATHLKCLEALLDIRNLFVTAALEVPEDIRTAIERMIPILRLFRHGDAALALFNGAQEIDLGAYESVLAQAGLRGRVLKSAPDTGYERMTQGRTVVLMDTGIMPPQIYAQNAHAGTLSFEMSVGRERLIVNCGAHPSSPKWIEALRSTAAHSTVTLDQANSTAFRDDGTIGRQPAIAVERHVLENSACLVEAEHTGYKPSHGITHRRRLFLTDSGQDLRGEDKLIGRGGLPYTVRFHLHPGVRAGLVKQGREALLQLPGGAGWRMKFAAPGEAELSLQDSVYLGRSTVSRRSQQLVISGITEQGATQIKWMLKRERKG